MATSDSIREIGTRKYWENFNPKKVAEEVAEKIYAEERVNNSIYQFFKGNLKKLASGIENLDDKKIHPKYCLVGKRSIVKISKTWYQEIPSKDKKVGHNTIGRYMRLYPYWQSSISKEELVDIIEEVIKDYIDIRLSRTSLREDKISIEGVATIELKLFIEGISAYIEILDNDFYFFKKEIEEVVQKKWDNTMKIMDINSILSNEDYLEPLSLINDKDPIFVYKHNFDKGEVDIFEQIFIKNNSKIAKDTFMKIKDFFLSGKANINFVMSDTNLTNFIKRLS